MLDSYALALRPMDVRLGDPAHLVDNNRVVRPLEWGVEWARDWPCRNGHAPGHTPRDPEKFLREFNQRIVANSDEFFSYARPRTSGSNGARSKSSAPVKFRTPGWKNKVRGTYARLSALHLAGALALRGKQSGECPLVSRPADAAQSFCCRIGTPTRWLTPRYAVS